MKRYLPRRPSARLALALAALTAAVGGGTAIAASSTGPQRSEPMGVAQSATAGMLAQMTRAYPVLAQPEQPGAVSGILDNHMLDPYLASQGVSLSTIRRAAVTSQGVSVYLAPGNGVLCIATSDNAISQCGQFPQTNPSWLGAVESAVCSPGLGPDFEVAAILPAGVTSAHVSYSDGTSQAVSAPTCVIDLEGPRSGPLPKTISWSGPSGAESAPSSLPPDTAAANCVS